MNRNFILVSSLLLSLVSVSSFAADGSSYGSSNSSDNSSNRDRIRGQVTLAPGTSVDLVARQAMTVSCGGSSGSDSTLPQVVSRDCSCTQATWSNWYTVKLKLVTYFIDGSTKEQELAKFIDYSAPAELESKCKAELAARSICRVSR